MPNLLDLAKQELQKRNIIKAVQQPAQQQQPTTPIIHQEEYDMWRKSLNPADYKTALSPQETQQFTDWAAKTNVPITDDYDMQGFWKNEVAPYAALEGKFTPEQIALARQGINGGNAELAKFIDDNKIKKPTTVNEIIAAKKGQFNSVPYDAQTMHFTDKYKTPLHDTYSNESIYAIGDNAKYAGKWDGDKFISPVQQAMVTGLMDKVKGGLADISVGYDDNARNKFDFSNLQADQTKSGWQRFGEALGTGQRLLSNPALQGLIAGTIYGKQRGDVGEGLKYGIDWAQNKANQNYYADVMNQPRRIIGGYSADDYKAMTEAKRKEFQNQIEQARYEVYAKNLLDQIDWRAKNFDEKVREFALKYNLDERKLAQQIKYQTGMLSISKERNALTRDRNNIAREKIKGDRSKDVFKLLNDYNKLDSDFEKQNYIASLATAKGVPDETLAAYRNDDDISDADLIEYLYDYGAN